MDDDRIEVILDEEAAVDRALHEVGDGELALILADDVPGVLAQLHPHSSGTAAV
jgi:hypothetical protein